MMRALGKDLARIAGLAMVAGCSGQGNATPTVIAPVETTLPPLPPSSEEAKPHPRHEVQVATPSHDSNCCAAKNACKGKGMCKTDKHDCKGKNDCKGLGGCKDPDCESMQQ